MRADDYACRTSGPQQTQVQQHGSSIISNFWAVELPGCRTSVQVPIGTLIYDTYNVYNTTRLDLGNNLLNWDKSTHQFYRGTRIIGQTTVITLLLTGYSGE